MRTEHYLFHVLGIAPKSRAKVCVQWMPRYFDTGRSKAGDFGVTLFFMFIGPGEGVSCRSSYSVVRYMYVDVYVSFR